MNVPARPARNEEFASHHRFAPNAGARPLDRSCIQSWGELVHPDSRLAQRTESVPGLGHALRPAFPARELVPTARGPRRAAGQSLAVSRKPALSEEFHTGADIVRERRLSRHVRASCMDRDLPELRTPATAKNSRSGRVNCKAPSLARGFVADDDCDSEVPIFQSHARRTRHPCECLLYRINVAFREPDDAANLVSSLSKLDHHVPVATLPSFHRQRLDPEDGWRKVELYYLLSPGSLTGRRHPKFQAVYFPAKIANLQSMTIRFRFVQLNPDTHQFDVVRELVNEITAHGSVGRARLIGGDKSSLLTEVSSLDPTPQNCSRVDQAVKDAHLTVRGRHRIDQDGWDPTRTWQGLSTNQIRFESPCPQANS